MLNILFFKVTFLLYFASAILYILFFVFKKYALNKAGYGVAAFGFLLHTAFLIERAIEAKHLPLATLFESVNFFGWSTMLLFLLVEYKYRLGILGSFLLPVVFLIIFYASFLSKQIVPLPPALESYWLGIHVTLAFLSYGAFVLSFVTGVMYLILPSIETLDYLSYKSISLGFPLLTLGIITGALWANNAWGSYWSWDPKETWSLITWLIYASYLHARVIAGWRGRKAAYLSIVGFGCVLFTYFGVNLLLGGLHSYV
jgi:ABC-type transport system involved in cytochrome c biogenesis permease subunit